jgi:hypothetical protein
MGKNPLKLISTSPVPNAMSALDWARLARAKGLKQHEQAAERQWPRQRSAVLHGPPAEQTTRRSPSMTPATRGTIAICIWSTRLLALAVMVVAIGEVVNCGLCLIEDKKAGRI